MDHVRHRKNSLVPLTAAIALGSAGHTLGQAFTSGNPERIATGAAHV